MNDLLFIYSSATCAPKDSRVRMVVVPEGMSDKQILLRLFAAQLLFPEYFGHNWDALEECLVDLSWLQEPLVYICHKDLPLVSKPDEARRYLQVLDVVLHEPGNIPLKVIFPERIRNEIRSLLGIKQVDS